MKNPVNYAELKQPAFSERGFTTPSALAGLLQALLQKQDFRKVVS